MSDSAWRNNQSFSLTIPKLQIAWDSTSMGTFKECPRKYELSIIEGWQPRERSVHLTFGLHYHAALEKYDHLKCQGQSHEAALRGAVRYAMEITWDQERKRPWISDDPNKNRFTLVRSIVWYLEQFGADDPLKTVVLANGKPAVELSFKLETDYKTKEGEPFLMCGHLDRVAIWPEQNNQTFIVDRKTTKSTIDQRFFDKFSPDNQFSTYVTAGKVIYSLPLHGLIVDGAQIAVTFTRFQRGLVPRHDSQIEEWYREFGMWLSLAEAYARAGHWPMNDKSCGNYGGCPFQGICSKPPGSREQWLQNAFHRRVWNPLQSRGDI